jgi:hypothetical protein
VFVRMWCHVYCYVLSCVVSVVSDVVLLLTLATTCQCFYVCSSAWLVIVRLSVSLCASGDGVGRECTFIIIN